jgi:putative membrane protein
MEPHPSTEVSRPPVDGAEPPRRTRPLVHFGQGLLMGTADVVPGVSGGTVALIVGIYERLIEAVRAVTAVPLKIRRGVGAVREGLFAVEWRFIIPLGIGILSAIVIGARFIPPVMEAYPEQSRALFFGLVTASLIVPWQRAGRVRWGGYALALAAAALAFFLVAIPMLRAPDPGLLRVFASAAVAICAMILPGVSGAFLLKVLGLYEPTLAAVSGLDVAYILVFVLGALTGLSVFARLLSFLLARYYTRTMVVLVGLLAGSLRALWPWQGTVMIDGELVSTPERLLAPPTLEAAGAALLAGAVGFGLVALLIWFGHRRQRLQDA